jgi:hypothetical protein
MHKQYSQQAKVLLSEKYPNITVRTLHISLNGDVVEIE